IVRSRLSRVRSHPKWLSAVTLTSNLSGLSDVFVVSVIQSACRVDDSSPGCAAAPPACDASDYPAHHDVRRKTEQQCNDKGFVGVESLQLEDLVDRVHHQTEQDNPRGRIQTLAQPSATLPRVP